MSFKKSFGVKLAALILCSALVMAVFLVGIGSILIKNQASDMA